MKPRRIIATASALALAATPAALAKKPDDPGSKGKAKAELKGQNGKGKGKSKNLSVKGVVTAVSTDGTSVTIDVTKSNKHGAFLRDSTGPLVFSAEKIIVADTNADGAVNASDLALGDQVHVLIRIAKDADLTAVLGARKIIDQTNPPADDDEEATAPAESTPVAPATA